MSQVYINAGGTIVNASDVRPPADRVFREAWQVNDAPAIQVDMEKARLIWRDKIRLARKSALERLDAEYMKALERNEEPSGIIEQKQALRDAPADPAIDAADTPEALKLVSPADLVLT